MSPEMLAGQVVDWQVNNALYHIRNEQPVPGDLSTLGKMAWERMRRVTVVAREVVGDYQNIPRVWHELAKELPERLLSSPNFRAVTVYHDDGLKTAERKMMRAHIGFLELDDCFPKGFGRIHIPAGTYLSTEAVADSRQHSSRWWDFNCDWVVKRAHKPNQPALDIYGASLWSGIGWRLRFFSL